MDDVYKFRKTDRIIVALCNFLMRFASPGYRSMLAGMIEYGRLSAYKDTIEGNESPVKYQAELDSLIDLNNK